MCNAHDKDKCHILIGSWTKVPNIFDAKLVLAEIREDGKECGFSFPLEPIKIHPSKLGGKNVVYMEFTILAILIRDLNL